MLHFGVEYAPEPVFEQRLLAEAAIDAGAVLVIGSHPHVLQDVEEYGGGLIAYSLGNFVFDGFEGDANTTALLEVTLTAEGVTEFGGSSRPRWWMACRWWSDGLLVAIGSLPTTRVSFVRTNVRGL